MRARKWVVVLSATALLTGQTSAEILRPVGLVLEADKARLDNSQAQRGASVFREQQLSTEAGGRLLVHFQQAQIALADQSAVWLEGPDGQLQAVLRKGAVSFAAKGDRALQLSVNGVLIRANGNQAAHGAVRIVSAQELLVTSYSGALTASFAGTTQIIPAGTTYHATLAPPESPQVGGGRRRGVAPILWVAAGAVALGVGLWLALRGNDVSPSIP